MNNASDLADETSRDDSIYTKPHLISSVEKQSVAPYVLNSMTWEDEVEKVVVLCNN